MGINLNFNVLNQKGAPALYEDLFANRPAASYAGRIFLATDTGDLYRDTGTTWFQIATSGGGTPGIDDVLAVGQSLTANREIDFDNLYELMFKNYQKIEFNSASMPYVLFDIEKCQIGDYTYSKDGTTLIVDESINKIYTKFANVDRGLSFDFNNNIYKFGDFSIGNNPQIELNNLTNTVEIGTIGFQTGIYQDCSNSIIKIGNYQTGNNCLFYLDGEISTKQAAIKGNSTTSGLIDVLFCDFINDNYRLGYNPLIQFTNNIVNFSYSGQINGLNINFNTNFYQFGKIYNGAGNKDLIIEFDNNTIITYSSDNQNGLFLDFGANQYKYGDLATNQTFLQVIGSNNIIETYFNNLQYGFSADGTNKLTLLGDYNGNTNNTTISIDDTNTIITLYSNDEIYLNDNGTGNMISATASGSSGDHLVININGNQYKIALLNP